MRKLLATMLSAALMVSAFAGCSNSNSPSSESGSASKAESASTSSKTIAYLTPSLDVPFWRYVKTGVEEAGKANNMTVQAYDSKDSADTQLKNAQDAIVKQVAGIVISPVDSASCVTVLSLAEENNIPVVICDIGTNSGTYASFISTDNEKGAKEVGEYVAKKLKEGDKVAQITLNQARINGQLRKKGFEEGVATNKLVQVGFKQMEKVNRQEGESFAQDLITANPDLKALFVHSEDPSMGAVTAATAANRSDVMIVGFDCSPEVIEAIKAGTIAATAAQQPILMGKTSVDQLVKVLNGQTPEKEVKMDTILITKENIAELEAGDLYKTVLTKD
jgi:ribose transport system substrate-binding protein